MSYKQIIAAVDGSAMSDSVLREAVDLSKSLQSKLCVIYVVDKFPICNLALGADFDRCEEIIRNKGEEILYRMKDIAQKSDVIIETELVEIIDASKKISEKIIDTALSRKADLIVLGTHGRRGFNRFILGSVAEETVRISPLPLLLIRTKES